MYVVCVGEEGELRIVHNSDNHNHAPDIEQVAKAKLKSDLCKLAAENPTRSLGQVYRAYVTSDAAPQRDDDDFLVPALSSCKSQMNRARRRTLPTLPQTRADVHLEGEWSRTKRGDDFVVHQDEEMVIFSTTENLERLAGSDTIFIDGTFKIAPRIYCQMYSFHVLFLGFFIPLVYALLPDKTRNTYYRMFEILKGSMARLNLQWNPAVIMTDFEQAMIACLRLQFPGSAMKGCNFHFAQAIWRQVQHLGLTQDYRETPEVRRVIRSLMALAHVPVAHVRRMFHTLSNMNGAAAVPELLNYFQRTWLDGQFPVRMWNVHGSETYTNNKLESWHHKMNAAIGKAHPNVFELIKCLEDEQEMRQVTTANAALGQHPAPSRRIYRERREAIRQLENELATGARNLDEYLAGMRRHMGCRFF